MKARPYRCLSCGRGSDVHFCMNAACRHYLRPDFVDQVRAIEGAMPTAGADGHDLRVGPLTPPAPRFKTLDEAADELFAAMDRGELRGRR